MFRLENVTKVYSRRGREVVAFCTASLEIPRGRICGGRRQKRERQDNAAIHAGRNALPNDGRVWLDGASLYDLSITQRARIRRERSASCFKRSTLCPI